MNRSRRIEIALVVFALCSTLVFAQSPGGPPAGGPGGPGGEGGRGGRGGGGRRQPLPPLLQALDVNGDKVLDASEIAGAAASLKTLDLNADGDLSLEEYLPSRPEMEGPGGEGAGMGRPAGEGGAALGDTALGPPPETGGDGMGPQGPGGRGGQGGGAHSPLALALDASGDGVIDSREISGAAGALRALDTDGDGAVSREELHPVRPGGRGEGGGRMGGPRGQGGPDQGPPPDAGGYAPSGGSAPPPSEGAKGTWPGRGEAPIAPREEGALSVTGVTSLSRPTRLLVSGEGFQPGCSVLVNARPAPSTTFKGSTLLEASGAGLEGLLPKGVAVHVSVLNPDGAQPAGLAFTR